MGHTSHRPLATAARRPAAELDPPSRAAALVDNRPASVAQRALAQAISGGPGAVAQLEKGAKAAKKAADKERLKQREAQRARGARESQSAKDSTRDTGAMVVKADKKHAAKAKAARELREDRTANNQAIQASYQAIVVLRANPPGGAAPGSINCGDHGVAGGTTSPIRLQRRNDATGMSVASELQASRSGVLSRHYPHANGTIIVHVT